MSCCAPGAELLRGETADEELLLASRLVDDGLRQTDLAVPGIHCGACVRTIESTLGKLDGVVNVRVNLSNKRVTICWRGAVPPPFLAVLKTSGYDAHVQDILADERNDPALNSLLRSLAVAGFGASNIMLLSVSIWSGAEPDTRDVFHLISALIALPVLAYSGQVFFQSAWVSLRHGRTNMDVPISIGVLLAFGLSLYETVHHGPHAYFDAAVSLLFFLLIGRTLDHVMRERARRAVYGLARLSPRGARMLRDDGSQLYLPLDEIEPGMTLLLAAGERVPVNARILKGRSEFDCALVSGESAPQSLNEGATLQAGLLNLTGSVTILATATAENSFLAEMMRMMEAAETGRSAYRRIADRVSRLYAPVVHLTSFLTFIGWMIVSGDAHRAITIAIAVLIITCPCALGLAVPMVHVVAARRLFEAGILMKDGSALERLAEVSRVVFDKTGTLTFGQPKLLDFSELGDGKLALAAAIAAHSRHPYSKALASATEELATVTFETVSEYPGAGVEARSHEAVYRLGRSDWATTGRQPDVEHGNEAVVLSMNGQRMATFRFDDRLRSSARETVAALNGMGLDVEILSGDSNQRVERVADELGLARSATARPADKVQHLTELRQRGHKVLMVGDGLNDAPALMTADVSMAPGSAADVGRNAADLVFLRDGLEAVPLAVHVARRANALVRQNLGMAIAYNAIAIPVATFGLVTPLIAALAMSISSVLVVSNSLRLRLPVHPRS
ncbi:MAG: cadmium-translocating P-type ATPase [Xanthobacteraceae bacterium]|nr:cadmium-translocating P-type ATPase [Xanthobacteraceae bacterium]